MDWAKRAVYPFPAIVGQEKLKKALMLNAISPDIGGVLIRGEKGTAKSTAVRALAALLPNIDITPGCPYNCAPGDSQCPMHDEHGSKFPESRHVWLVDLPVGATEDRVIGTLCLEQAIRSGARCFEPGLLATAHRGILYIDEVNLLPDHVADVILDAASSGRNVVEREGLSFMHPSSFILVGTMNPEEGQLRPQLLDRFGLCVDLEGLKHVNDRVELLRRRNLFEKEPHGFKQQWEAEIQALKKEINLAVERIREVELPSEMEALCSELSLQAYTNGLRADLIIHKTAKAIAALEGQNVVREEHILEAAEMALAHRRNSPPSPPEKKPDSQSDKADEPAPENRDSESRQTPPEQMEPPDEPQDNITNIHAPPREQVFPSGDPFQVKDLPTLSDRLPRSGSGKRTRTRTPSRSGRYVLSRFSSVAADIALDATIRAAAPYQLYRDKQGMALAIRKSDLREKVREKRVGNFIVFVVDASGSMGARKRMIETKSAILSLLLDAYQKRDKICLIAFRGEGAEVLLPPTGSVEFAYRLLEELPTGGRTPLAQGLDLGLQVIESQLFKDRKSLPLLVLVTDGRANFNSNGNSPVEEARNAARSVSEIRRLQSVIIDVESDSLLTFGLAGELAELMNAAHYKIEDLRAQTLAGIVRSQIH